MALFSLNHPRFVVIAAIIVTVLFALALPRVKIDTDPENMLSEDEPVRVFHDKMKDRFNLYDMVVLGVVNEEHPEGVFNPSSLEKIYELTEFSKTLRWQDPDNPDEQVGVVLDDILAPSEVDNIEQGGLGTVKFEWLMKKPPETQEEAEAIRDSAVDNPLLYGTLISDDKKAIALYLPLTSKDMSYRIYNELNKKIEEFEGPEEYHVTGLPVAEDTFGVQMFKQMAFSAPLAMLVIFILMFVFFRKVVLILSPLIIAFMSVVWTMGLLIALGYPVHIMSSMIPIFIMPIAVLDSVHIKSEFFDLYQGIKNKRQTLVEVMHHLFTPMLYTSLTTMAGFSSLALTPIPPVQVFGLFVAFGVGTAWFLTVTFVPAFTMLIPEKSLENFGMKKGDQDKPTPVSRFLHAAGGFTYRRFRLILIAALIVAILSIYGISKIQVNDNPVKWFTKNHPIRVADRVLNQHFAGTYMAYLVLDPDIQPEEATVMLQKTLTGLEAEMKADYPESGSIFEEARNIVSNASGSSASMDELEEKINNAFEEKRIAVGDAENYDALDVWDEIEAVVIPVFQPFKNPDLLRYIADIDERLLETEVVGKSNTETDLVKKVHKELFEGKDEYYSVPDTAPGVAQTLISFQNSHKPNMLWHLVTGDYKLANLWVQLKSGDNREMSRVVRELNSYFEDNPGPMKPKHKWFGLTYINVIWQEKMVKGMLESFLGSFLIVWIMMLILYRSVWWGTIAMLPMTLTVAVIYGFIGFIGKDYDMPVAVLSALTLGLAVDFSIHFLTRSRDFVRKSETGEWNDVRDEMFGEPARAIARNIIVIAVGFLPLLDRKSVV